MKYEDYKKETLTLINKIFPVASYQSDYLQVSHNGTDWNLRNRTFLMTAGVVLDPNLDKHELAMRSAQRAIVQISTSILEAM